MQYFEDIPIEGPVRLGSHTVTEAEIVEFAEAYDPLPMHTSRERAAESRFSGIIASGFHTLAIANRIVVNEYTADIAAVAGLGIDDLRWTAPVRPDDTLAVYCETTGKRPSDSNPDVGILTNEITVENDGDPVLTYVSRGLVQKRDGDRNESAE